MISKSKVTILVPWMEVIGPFIRLEEREEELLAEIAEHIVVLPRELRDVLTPHLGCKIAILATDIPGREYLVRVIPEKNPDERDGQCGICETLSRGHDQPFVAMLTQKGAV